MFVVAVGGGYDPTVGAARPWLYGIATNLVARHRSRRVKGADPRRVGASPGVRFGEVAQRGVFMSVWISVMPSARL